jgi:hypothetical protein
MEELLKDDIVLARHLWNDDIAGWHESQAEVQLTPITHLSEKHPRHCTTPKSGVTMPRPESRTNDVGTIEGAQAFLAQAAF